MSLFSHKLFPHHNVFVFDRDARLEKEMNITHTLVRQQLALAPLYKELLTAFVETLTACSSSEDMLAIQAIYEKAMECPSAAILTNATATLQLYFAPQDSFLATGT